MKNKRITAGNIFSILAGLLSIVAIGKFCELVWSKQEKPTVKPMMVEITVRKGYCLSQIALDLGTDWREVAKINNLADPNKIYPGQVLKVRPFNRNNIMEVSWYGPGFHGKKMSNRQIFNMYDPTTAAQKWLPIGRKVRLTRIDIEKSIIVVVRDRGPYSGNRSFDLSYAAAQQLEMIEIGHIKCKVEILP